MAKLAKNCYYDKNGEKKINCYLINIPKKVVKQSGINPEAQLKIYANNGKIIIEKSN